MKNKVFKAVVLIILWAVVMPLGAGYAVMNLWNWIMPLALGSAEITLWQGVGMFVLGQLLSAGFIAGLFLLGSIVHVVFGHHHHRNHWRDMTEEEQREFFERRRQWFRMCHFGNTAQPNEGE